MLGTGTINGTVNGFSDVVLVRTVSFSVQVSGIVNIDMGELLYGYYRVEDKIRQVTLTKRIYHYPIVYDAPYGSTLVLKGTSDAIYFITALDETWITCSYYSVFLRSYTTTTFTFPLPYNDIIFI